MTFCLSLIIAYVATYFMLDYSKLIGAYMFVIITLIVRTKFSYIELFQNNTGNTNTVNNDITNDNYKALEEGLIKQITDDPNITPIEKQVIIDTIKTYLQKSNKLEILKRFNDSADKVNPISNAQNIVNILNNNQ